jgi:hypothetical protein
VKLIRSSFRNSSSAPSTAQPVRSISPSCSHCASVTNPLLQPTRSLLYLLHGSREHARSILINRCRSDSGCSSPPPWCLPSSSVLAPRPLSRQLHQSSVQLTDHFWPDDLPRLAQRGVTLVPHVLQHQQSNSHFRRCLRTSMRPALPMSISLCIVHTLHQWGVFRQLVYFFHLLSSRVPTDLGVFR